MSGATGNINNDPVTWRNCYEFNPSTSNWQQTQDQKTNTSNLPTNQSITLSTYNILDGVSKDKPWYTYIRGDESRFAFIFNTILPNLDSDILCLNEVTNRSLPYLKKQAYFQKLYISDIELPRRKYNVIVSKYPFKCTDQGEKSIYATFGSEGVGAALLVGSVHLIAYEELKYVQKRRQEMRFNEDLIFRRMPESGNPLAKKAVEGRNVVLLGDFNLHNLNETDLIYKNDYRDVWLDVKGLNDVGYTWDSKENKFVSGYLKFENRRMRLDRVMLKKKSKNVVFENIRIFAKELMKFGIWSGINASDHFGLTTLFKIVDDAEEKQVRAPFDYELNRSRIIGNRDENGTGFRPLKDTIAIRKRVLGLIALTVLVVFTSGVIGLSYLIFF